MNTDFQIQNSDKTAKIYGINVRTVVYIIVISELISCAICVLLLTQVTFDVSFCELAYAVGTIHRVVGLATSITAFIGAFNRKRVLLLPYIAYLIFFTQCLAFALFGLLVLGVLVPSFGEFLFFSGIIFKLLLVLGIQACYVYVFIRIFNHLDDCVILDDDEIVYVLHKKAQPILSV